MRTLDVTGLGWDAVIVDVEGEAIVLIEADLDVDQRIDVLSRVMEKNESEDEDD